jgi:hypothetical protein
MQYLISILLSLLFNLFKHCFKSQVTKHGMKAALFNDKLERMRKETAMYNTIYCSGTDLKELRKTTTILSQKNHYRGQYWNGNSI